MVTYEVTSTVREDLCAAYELFMRERHIPDLLETGCFAEASLSRSAPGRYRVRYEAHDRAALDRYLAEHASRLRADFGKEFPTGIEPAREEWMVLGRWSAAR